MHVRHSGECSKSSVLILWQEGGPHTRDMNRLETLQVQSLRALVAGDSELYLGARHVVDMLLDFSGPQLPVEKVCTWDPN